MRLDRSLDLAGELYRINERFQNEMTFVDPDDATRTVFAHWHGKIRHRHFRMHFEWPVSKGILAAKGVLSWPEKANG